MPPTSLLLLLSLSVMARAAIPTDWIECTPGNCNVIVSSPHGGSNRVSEIPDDRTDGCWDDGGSTCRWEKGCSPADSDRCRAATFRDSFTQEIAAMVVQHLTESYGCQPHFVRSSLHRSKLDPNRESGQGAQGDPLALEAWHEYHDLCMTSAVNSVRAQFVRGLVFDFHGQGHPEQWTELGYLVPGFKLDKFPTDLTFSSIRSLWSRSGGNATAASNLLAGPGSLGALLESRGQKVVPGPTHPSPNGGNYFSGGVITAGYGSLNTDGIDAIQLEIPSEIRFNSTRRAAFAADLAASVDEFRRIHGYA